MIMKCKDVEINQFESKCDVILSNNFDENIQDKVYCNKLYDIESGRFEDLPEEAFDDEVKCCSCSYRESNDLNKNCELDSQKECEEEIELYKSFTFKGVKYSTGDFVKICSNAFEMDYFNYEQENSYDEDDDYDEDIYTEKYRKAFSDYIKGSYDDVPNPCHVCQILKIFRCDDQDEIYVSVRKFYRPRNVISDFNEFIKCDFNLLFWSDEQVNVQIVDIIEKCKIIYSCENSANFFTNPNCFYFNECYNNKEKVFYPPSNQIIELFKHDQIEQNNAKDKKFNVLDVFAGCGGLAYGFEMITSKLWAIEKDPSAADSFSKNFPSSIMFNDDVNHFLSLVLDGKEYNEKSQRLPKKGEIDMILGGPPCQGFSGMNRFSSRQYSLFKNSLVVSFLSFVDFYKPKYFLFENVRNFAIFKQSMVLKLTLSCLVNMGYQCQFAIVQAGNYGVPQTRRRTVIIGALPHYKLPNFPQPTHVFSARQCHLSVIIDKRKYSYNIKQESGSFRNVTVKDAINDLPLLLEDDYSNDIERVYASPTNNHYQKVLRINSSESLYDHVCREIGLLCRARIQLIPKVPGADWRDLPNVRHPLGNGIVANKLMYNYDDKKNGKSKTGQLRGVCACASGQVCNGNESKQENTLIPWCLVHTANRQYQWSGLYGRLSWLGYFPTTVTLPEPISKQGRVLHPDQDRTISIREAARSQGFPDNFKFSGSILDRFRQVGNAVPPPLSIAFAREFKQSIDYSIKQNKF